MWEFNQKNNKMCPTNTFFIMKTKMIKITYCFIYKKSKYLFLFNPYLYNLMKLASKKYVKMLSKNITLLNIIEKHDVLSMFKFIFFKSWVSSENWNWKVVDTCLRKCSSFYIFNIEETADIWVLFLDREISLIITRTCLKKDVLTLAELDSFVIRRSCLSLATDYQNFFIHLFELDWIINSQNLFHTLHFINDCFYVLFYMLIQILVLLILFSSD